jgi:ATP-dependent helicase/nuclease subunit A
MMLADQETRESIRRDLDVTMMVEAAAGTGKTTWLVTRIVELIRTGRCTVDTLAATTFTVKAAAQLRERLQEALEKALAGASRDEHERIRRAIDDLERALIGTTHAFCARMLRERPVESGLDPDFEELDEVQTKLLIEDFWDRWYDAQQIAAAEPMHRALAAGLKPKMLRSAFLRLVEYADVEIVATQCDRPDLSGIVRTMLEFVRECEPCFPDDLMRDKQDRFEQLMRDLVRKRDSSDLSEPDEQLAFLEIGAHGSAKPTQKNWPDKKQAKDFGERYGALANQVLKPTIVRWREYVHCIAIELLRPGVEQFEAERLRNGTLTFNDLLIRARDLLRDHPSVRRYFQRRFTHVLVDEFQDTDPVQAEVLFYLTGAETEERNWRALRPRAGSLFIVGDPKQSIYRFRRADITTYMTVKRLIRESAGKIVELRTNFRSVRSICDFVNDTFRPLFTDDEVRAGRQAAHVDLAWHHEGGAIGGTYVLETAIATQDEVAQEEARCVARWIRRAVDSRIEVDDAGKRRPARYGDFLLISDRKPRLSFYARALERESIAFELTGGEGFWKSAELAQVLPLLQAVVDVEDAVSLVAFLRGPLCGASDDALYRFVKSGARFSLLRDVPQDADPTIVAGFAIARDALDAVRELPPAATIARIFQRVGLTALAAMADQGSTRAGNTLLALALARRDSAGGESVASVIKRLAQLLQTEAAIEELDVDPARANAVRLMNLHQVKGLEAPVVFLIDPIGVREHEPDLFVDRSGEKSIGHFAIRERIGWSWRNIAVPHDWNALAAREQEFQLAERKRLLYVAATRAKGMLIVGVTMKNGERGGIWSALARNAPQLFAIDDVAVPAPVPESATETYEEGVREIESRYQSASTASYSVLPITKIAHANHAELVRAEEGLGKGMSWGRVLHRLFEAMLRDESLDVRLYAENLLKDEERDVVELTEVMRVVEAVQSSPLWQHVKSADERYVEIPFALKVRASELGLDGPPETLLHGTIDLVFREGTEWFVVDYKTDSTANRLDALTDYYAPQVRLYADFWSRLVSARTRGGLFFVDGCVEGWVS